jgi:hypothetical protein
MASPDASQRKPWGQLIPTNDGKYVQLYEDGSMTVYDQYYNVVSDDTSPNPKRAALISAGRENDAKQDALYSAASVEDARRFNENQQRTKEQTANQAQQIKNQYILGLRNAKSEEERNAITKWYNEQQVELAKAKLGFDLVSTAASLKGPADYVQQANYSRGISNNGGAAFLSALQSNARMAGYGAQQGTPDAESLDSLTSKLTGSYGTSTGGTTNASGQNGYRDSTGTTTAQTATGGTQAATADSTGTSTAQNGTTSYFDNANDLKAKAGQIYAAGAHKLTSGSLEQLTPTELALLKSGVDADGGDWSTFLSQYGRSRVGQSIGGSAYKAA